MAAARCPSANTIAAAAAAAKAKDPNSPLSADKYLASNVFDTDRRTTEKSSSAYAEYTRDLGHSAVRFLLSPESGKYGAIISLVEGKTRPLPFETMLNPATKRMQTRRVDISSEGFECALRFMTRVEKADIEDPARLAKLAAAANLDPAAFKARFAGSV
mgnify:CR=1 FL=1